MLSGIPTSLGAAVVAAVAIAGAARDLRLVSCRLPEPRRQVPRAIFRQGLLPASLRFGFELGLGWLTYVPCSLPYVLLVALLLLQIPFPVAAVAGLGFGAGRAAVSVLRLLDPAREAWDHRMANAAGWLAPVSSVLGMLAVAAVLSSR